MSEGREPLRGPVHRNEHVRYEQEGQYRSIHNGRRCIRVGDNRRDCQSERTQRGGSGHQCQEERRQGVRRNVYVVEQHASPRNDHDQQGRNEHGVGYPSEQARPTRQRPAPDPLEQAPVPGEADAHGDVGVAGADHRED